MQSYDSADSTVAKLLTGAGYDPEMPKAEIIKALLTRADEATAAEEEVEKLEKKYEKLNDDYQRLLAQLDAAEKALGEQINVVAHVKNVNDDLRAQKAEVLSRLIVQRNVSETLKEEKDALRLRIEAPGL